MANVQQQRSFQRKLIYVGAILVLFGVTWYTRNRLQARAYDLALVEEAKGQVELGGSAVRLMLTGSRGFAVCVLWLQVQDAQKKNEWNKVELLSRYTTKLQPHFVAPWLFQSWNIAYNVSHEAEQPRDKYYYMARGIEMLAEGERRNRNNPELRWHIAFYYHQKIGQHDEKDFLNSLFQLSCIDPLERDPARFFRYEWNTLASSRARADGVPSGVTEKLKPLLQESYRRQDQFRSDLKERLSDKEYTRYADRILRSSRLLKPNKFLAFCRNHPQLVRRLYDRVPVHLTNHAHKTPEEVIGFLEENRDVPSLYLTGPTAVEGNREEEEREEVPSNRTKLAKEDERFPVLPLPPGKRDVLPGQRVFDFNEISSDSPLGDDFDPFVASRSWYSYSLEPLPPPSKDKPGWNEPIENRITQRLPKRRSILMRMMPARAHTYICERLTQEGWFDRWDIAEAFDSNPDKPVFDARPEPIGRANILKETWEKDFDMWKRVGEENYLLVDPEEVAAKSRLRDVFQEEVRKHNLLFNPLMQKERLPRYLRPGFEAAMFVWALDRSTRDSNFNSFYYNAIVEKHDWALQARRHFFNAEDHTQATIVRIREYAAGLQLFRRLLAGEALAEQDGGGMKPLLEPRELASLREDHTLQQELFEYELKYLFHFQQQVDGGLLITHALLAQELVGMAATASLDPQQRLLSLSHLEHYEKSNRDWLRPLILGPLDEADQYGDAFVSDIDKQAVIGRFPANALASGYPPRIKRQGSTGPDLPDSASGIIHRSPGSPFQSGK